MSMLDGKVLDLSLNPQELTLNSKEDLYSVLPYLVPNISSFKRFKRLSLAEMINEAETRLTGADSNPYLSLHAIEKLKEVKAEKKEGETEETDDTPEETPSYRQILTNFEQNAESELDQFLVKTQLSKLAEYEGMTHQWERDNYQ